VVAVIVVLAARPGLGGATTGANSYSHDYFPGETQNYRVQFRGGGTATVTISGLDNTNVEVRVYDDLTFQQVASHVGGFTDQRTVSWTPPATRMYRIEVRNMGPRDNLVTTRHN